MLRIKELYIDLDNIEQEVEPVKDAAHKLNCKFVEEANYIGRMDRISALQRLKSRLFKEIDDIRKAENTAEDDFKSHKASSSLIGLFGATLGAAMAKTKDPLSVGKEYYNQINSVQACFGNVMVVQKDGNKLDDMEIISISKIARERRMTEAMVIAGYKNKGCTVLTPEQLKEQLDKLIEDTKNNTTTIYLKRRPVAVEPVTYKVITSKRV
jgi:hypothetical protein